MTDWTRGTGESFVTSCRAEPVTLVEGAVSRVRVIDWPWFRTEQWQGSGQIVVPEVGTMLALTAVAGEATVETLSGAVSLRRGQSAVVPASAGAIMLFARDLDLFATYSVPIP